MLQYPINVYPDKVAFDSTKSSYDRNMHFTFKGDQLTCIFYRIYNYDTQQVVLADRWNNATLTPLAYNNDTFDSTGNFLANLPKGRYILQMMFTETRTSLSNTAFLNSFDRFVSRGKTTQAYTANASKITIEDKVNVIYEWNESSGVYSHTELSVTTQGVTQTVRTTDMLMEIGGERVRINSYNYATGEITLEDYLTNSYAAGTPYKLYANYLITEQYYFEVAAEPTIQALSQDDNTDVWVTWDSHGGTFAGYFWQSGSALIQDRAGLKYYKVKLQKTRDTVSWDIMESDKIYSQDIEWKFTDDYDVASLHGGNYSTRTYKLTVDYVLQNGMSFTQIYTTTQPQRDDSKSISNLTSNLSNVDNKVYLDWREPEGGTTINYRVYRVDAAGLYNPDEKQDKRSKTYGTHPYKTLIGDVRGTGFNDYTIGTHKRVQYIIVPYEMGTATATTIYTPTVSPVVETDFYGYTLTSIKDSGKDADGKPVYIKGDIWKFMADIQDTDNVQNLNNVLHVGYGKYATSTSTDNNYMSGSLTASLGNMNCTSKEFEDDIEVVKAFRRFISQDCLFVLRSQKGDVWLVKIVDNSTTKYNESVSKIPVDFSFSWVECGDVDSILVADNLPSLTVDRR